MKKLSFIFLLIPFVGVSQLPPGKYLQVKSDGTGFQLADSSSFQNNLSVGTAIQTAPLTITNFSTTFASPQAGTIAQFVSNGVTNGRISFDTYNGSNNNGSTFQGRRAGGNAGSPTAALADYTLSNFSGDGWGSTGFHNVSLGAIAIRSEATMTDISAPTYITFFTTGSGSISASEKMRIKSTGVVQINGLNSVGVMQTDGSGNVGTALLTKNQVTTALGYTPFAPTDTVPVKVTNAVEIANDAGNAIPVSGTVSVGNFPATQPVSGTFFQSTQPISAASLPLPTGASTSALQTTGNTSLSNIDGDLGAAGDAAVTNPASSASVIAALKGVLTTTAAIGTTSDAAQTDPTQSASMVALLKGLLTESVAQASSGTRTTYTLVTNTVQTIAANANRKACIISTSSGTIYIGLGATTVSSTSYDYKLAAGGTIEIPKEAAALAIQLVSASGNTVTVNQMQ